MALKFCANLSTMFQESGNLLDRYDAAAKAGFKAVEFLFPYPFPVIDVVNAKKAANVEQILINAYPGDHPNDLGIAALPARQDDFPESLEKSIEYAKALDCKSLHIMSGKSLPGIIDTAMGDVYKENIMYAAGCLEKHGIVGLIEPISQHVVPNYYMNSFPLALQMVKDAGSDFLKLQLDIFHLQMLEGNLTNRIKELLPYTGHIQISQVPDRHEPDSDGELNYQYILNLLEKYGYEGYIGLEYKPSTDSTKSLEWITKWGYSI